MRATGFATRTIRFVTRPTLSSHQWAIARALPGAGCSRFVVTTLATLSALFRYVCDETTIRLLATVGQPTQQRRRQRPDINHTPRRHTPARFLPLPCAGLLCVVGRAGAASTRRSRDDLRLRFAHQAGGQIRGRRGRGRFSATRATKRSAIAANLPKNTGRHPSAKILRQIRNLFDDPVAAWFDV